MRFESVDRRRPGVGIAVRPARFGADGARRRARCSVLAPGRCPAGCEKRGEVEVSVKDSLGFYERDALRVQDELETLARNEAPGPAAPTPSSP